MFFLLNVYVYLNESLKRGWKSWIVAIGIRRALLRHMPFVDSLSGWSQKLESHALCPSHKSLGLMKVPKPLCLYNLSSPRISCQFFFYSPSNILSFSFLVMTRGANWVMNDLQSRGIFG